MMKPLFILLLIALPAGINAMPSAQWFDRHAEGWFWYVVPPIEEEESKTIDKIPSSLTPLSAKAELEAFQKKLDNAQALAVMHSSNENVAAYLHLQKQAMERSQRFAKAWQQVVWTTPELDHTLVRPTSPQAVETYYDTRNTQHEVRLNTIAKTHGLFYFFRASCPYCQRFSPMLKRLVTRHGFHVTAISLDGGTSPGFPNPRVDNGTAKRLGVNTVPAVYLIEPRSRTVQPISFGLISPTELEHRIITLINPPHRNAL